MEFVRVSGLEPSQTALFEEWAQVFITSAVADRGDHDERSADDLRVMEGNEEFARQFLAAVEDDRVVGAAHVTLPLRDNLAHSFGLVSVLPAHRRRGVGTALLEWVEGVAREGGRSTLQMHTARRPGGAAPGGGFARRHGFGLAQTLLCSDLVVPQMPPERVVTGFRIETRSDIPTDWEEAYAGFQTAIISEMPLGDLALEPEVWDVERVRGLSQRLVEQGRSRLISVAVHEDSGELAAYSEIQWAPTMGERAYQQDTMVLRGHRGHGLGLAVKAANLTAVVDQWPQVRSIRTWNADDNSHMLAVNAALGCQVTAVMEEWQKHL
jgi:GNAT superfamily N-acetyltransferase